MSYLKQISLSFVFVIIQLFGLMQTAAAAEPAFELTLRSKMTTEPLWKARILTRKGEFTPGIEGPACDAAGNLYAVNLQRQGTIGRVIPNGSTSVFVELPEGSIGNGIRFNADGDFYVADYTGHNILLVDRKSVV